jgi:hypothetical protein
MKSTDNILRGPRKNRQLTLQAVAVFHEQIIKLAKYFDVNEHGGRDD